MFCEKCGNKLLDGERFCSVCGNPVEETESQKKTSDIMAGMGYGVSQEQPSKEASQDFYDDPHSNGKPKKKRKKDDDMEEEWRKEEKKEKITFIILGVIIVLLVAAIVAGIFFLVNSGDGKENERVQKMTEEQVNDLIHGKKEEEPEVTVTPEVTEEPEVTQEAEQDETAEPTAQATPVPTKEATPEPTREVTPVPTQAPVVVEENNDYIIPDSSTRYLTNADLNDLSEWEIRVARNEIYARHGRMFTSKDLAEYFEGKSWYTPSIPAEEFDNAYLNGIEIENLKFITDYEKAHNLNQ